jgi:hypothetical protein
MSLDFKLIEKSIQHAIISLEASETVCPGLSCISDFLDPELLLKLQNFIFNDNLSWDIQEYHTGVRYNNNRKKINWISDSVVEEIHIVLEGLTDYLNYTFNKKNKFLGLTIWKDAYSYQLSLHTDNPTIDMAIQIYLNSNNTNLGTKFCIGTDIFETPYKVNCGYSMDNQCNIPHYYDGKSPEDYYRYSLYAVWTKIQ